MEDLTEYTKYMIESGYALNTEDGYLYGPVEFKVKDLFDMEGGRTGLIIQPLYIGGLHYYIHTNVPAETAIPDNTFILPENEC